MSSVTCRARVDRDACANRGVDPAGGVPGRVSRGMRVRDNPGARATCGAKCARAKSRDVFCSIARQNAKYRQGYTISHAISPSAGPNDASTRQKHAFPS